MEASTVIGKIDLENPVRAIRTERFMMGPVRRGTREGFATA
jgi:hypothetical protein